MRRTTSYDALSAKIGPIGIWGLGRNEKRSKHSKVYFIFAQFFRKSTDALVGPIFTFNTSYDVVPVSYTHLTLPTNREV